MERSTFFKGFFFFVCRYKLQFYVFNILKVKTPKLYVKKYITKNWDTSVNWFCFPSILKNKRILE